MPGLPHVLPWICYPCPPHAFPPPTPADCLHLCGTPPVGTRYMVPHLAPPHLRCVTLPPHPITRVTPTRLLTYCGTGTPIPTFAVPHCVICYHLYPPTGPPCGLTPPSHIYYYHATPHTHTVCLPFTGYRYTALPLFYIYRPTAFCRTTRLCALGFILLYVYVAFYTYVRCWLRTFKHALPYARNTARLRTLHTRVHTRHLDAHATFTRTRATPVTVPRPAAPPSPHTVWFLQVTGLRVDPYTYYHTLRTFLTVWLLVTRLLRWVTLRLRTHLRIPHFTPFTRCCHHTYAHTLCTRSPRTAHTRTHAHTLPYWYTTAPFRTGCYVPGSGTATHHTRTTHTYGYTRHAFTHYAPPRRPLHRTIAVLPCTLRELLLARLRLRVPHLLPTCLPFTLPPLPFTFAHAAHTRLPLPHLLVYTTVRGLVTRGSTALHRTPHAHTHACIHTTHACRCRARLALHIATILPATHAFAACLRTAMRLHTPCPFVLTYLPFGAWKRLRHFVLATRYAGGRGILSTLRTGQY